MHTAPVHELWAARLDRASFMPELHAASVDAAGSPAPLPVPPGRRLDQEYCRALLAVLFPAVGGVHCNSRTRSASASRGALLSGWFCGPLRSAPDIGGRVTAGLPAPGSVICHI